MKGRGRSCAEAGAPGRRSGSRFAGRPRGADGICTNEVAVCPPRMNTSSVHHEDWSDRRAAIHHLASLVWLQARMIASYLWLFVRTKVFRAPLSPARLSDLHRLNARRFKTTACRLKGANVKIGQLASMQAHLLPPEYVEELRSLRDAVLPTEYPRIAAIVRAELGKAPASSCSSRSTSARSAAASMAQVHVARLKGGEKVVVKVLHPGLERSVSIDLALMGLLFWGLSLLFRKVDLSVILRESEEPLRRELDLELEGKATEELGRELEPMGVLVPKVRWDY